MERTGVSVTCWSIAIGYKTWPVNDVQYCWLIWWIVQDPRRSIPFFATSASKTDWSTAEEGWLPVSFCLAAYSPGNVLVYLGDGSERQLYVQPHWNGNWGSNMLSHPVTVCWHRANQSQPWHYNARRLAGMPLEFQFSNHRHDSTALTLGHRNWRRSWRSLSKYLAEGPHFSG